MPRFLHRLALLCLAACAGREGPADLGALPGVVVLAVEEGGQTPERTLTLGNRGNCALAFSADAFSSDGAAWLSVSPLSGLVPPDGSVVLTLAFDVATPGLLAGTYTGTLTIAGTCDATQQSARGSPRDVAINLTVLQATGAPGDVWEDLFGTVSPAARTRATAVADETRTYLFGGADGTGAPLAAPALYDGTGWQLLDGLPDEPAARTNHSAIFANAEARGLMVWGGRLAGGGLTDTGAHLYDDGENGHLWSPLPALNAPAAREEHGAAAAYPFMVVWGGRDGSGVLGDGKRFELNNNVWLAMGGTAPAARARHAMVTTFDGETDVVFVWGGEVAGGGATDTGGIYDPHGQNWRSMTSAGAPSGRTGMSAVGGGTGVIVWGGRDASGVRGDGAVYDLQNNSWSPIAPGPSAREGHTAVWTGTRMIVWGGLDGSGQPLGDGMSYDPATDQWTPVSPAGAPSARSGHVATWKEDRMIVWGGETGAGVTDTGKSYR